MVLDCGKTKFLGKLDELQAQFAGDQSKDSQSLEQAFFSALGDAQAALDAELGQEIKPWDPQQPDRSITVAE